MALEASSAGGKGELNGGIYSELLNQQGGAVKEIHDHVEAQVQRLESLRNSCAARRTLLGTFRKDVQESFHECRQAVKNNYAAMITYLRQAQEDMLKELDETMHHNMKELQSNSVNIDASAQKIETMIEEGHALLREKDTFTLFAKGSLFRQLPQPGVPRLDLRFKDNFPDLTQLSLLPYQVPMQHAVAVDIRSFLQSGTPSRICGNIFHSGFRFQIQIKHDERYLSAYLCLRAWHDVSAVLRVNVNFGLTLQDGPEVLHTANAKNTFEGQNDGWGWNKFVLLSKLQDCTEVLFLVTFHELSFHFVDDDATEPPLSIEQAPQAQQ